MALSNQTIFNMLAALQNEFGAFQQFEDVPASVLDAEDTDQAQVIDLPKFKKDATA